MNPDTNKFEPLAEVFDKITKKLFRPDGTEVPKHWSIFKVDEKVVIKDYTFVIKYIGENTLLLEPLGPVIIGKEDSNGQTG